MISRYFNRFTPFYNSVYLRSFQNFVQLLSHVTLYRKLYNTIFFLPKRAAAVRQLTKRLSNFETERLGTPSNCEYYDRDYCCSLFVLRCFHPVLVIGKIKVHVDCGLQPGNKLQPREKFLFCVPWLKRIRKRSVYQSPLWMFCIL